MAEIDVSDIIADGFISGDSFTVIRRLETVSDFGRVVITETRIPAFGQVTPTGDNSLVRAEAYQTQANTIKVITNFPLRGPAKDSAGNQYQPDVVEWRGAPYVVRVLNDYSAFGVGFVEAECSSMALIDPAPGTAP